ncbi:hypothetical protein [Psychrilyobacter atlanticus]|uniref:hypothetical protein n=1 Tax=Psychrilyobacter atlanticus TaxID=271091 RepID=UPI00041929FA|nr:hypothetical protein [Psychrilyobacter atlanticus]
MANTKKIIILITSLLSVAALGVEIPTNEVENLELIRSEEMEIDNKMGVQTDNTRVYLNEGAIWATRDINTIEPDMKITVNNEAVVESGNLKQEMNFSVKTNYGYYVKKWELAIYRGDDINLMAPIKTITGDELHNNMDIKWDGIAEDYDLKGGRQLLFRLVSWDAEGNMDITTTGVVDLVKKETDFTMEDFGELEDDKRTFGQAKLMRHNIPVNSGMVRFHGTNLVGVDKVIIGQEEYTIEKETLFAEEYLPTDRYFIPVEVVYDNEETQEYEIYVEIPEKYFVQTGLADMYIGKNYVTSNKEVLSVDSEYDGDIYNRGRLAYFGMGKFSDKLRVTAQMDTRENNIKDLFKDIYKSDSYNIFERVDDDDRYYPTYGDESTIRREVNTQGKLYLSVDYDKSRYLWGNYNTGLTATEFSQYNRSLYGAKADYRTRKTTSYGEDKLNLVGFVSEPNLLSSHDEFLGTGGSLYFLKHGDIAAGSDKVAIKLVNKTTKVTEDIIYIQEGKDYEIDNYQGRIILTRPLSDISSDSFGSIIKDNPRDGYENYLVVDYEYIPDDSDSMDNLTFGGRGKGWVNDHIGIGGTYVNEEKDAQDYQMMGTDLTLRATEGTYLTAEYSKSEGTQVDSNFVSFDGGLNFKEISNSNGKDKDGEAFRVAGVFSFYDLSPELFSPYGNDIKVWYQNKDAEYSYASKDDNLSWESYGTEIRYRPNNNLQFKSRYLSTIERDINEKKVTDTEELQIQGEYAVTDKLKVGAEAKHVQELENDKLGKGNLVGGMVEYEFTEDTKLYVKAQTTVSSNDDYSDNDLYTIGGETEINDKLKLTGEYSTGDRGYSADATADYSLYDDYDIYLGYVLEEMEDSDKNNVTFGQRASLTEKVDIYQENQFVDENNGKGRTDSYGIDYEYIEDYKIGAALQTGELKKDNEEDVRRRAISLYQSAEISKLTLKNKVEFRQDKGDEKVNQWVTTNSFKYKWTNEYTIVGKLNYSRTDNKTTSKKEAEFTEGNLGLAYRPIYNDKLNFLTRYTYLQDQEKESDRDIDYSDENSHIFEFETIYSYNARWDLGLKLAGKDKSEIIERASGNNIKMRTQIYLVGMKSTYHIIKNWDIFSEYHWKFDQYENALEQGALISVNRHLGNNLKVGLGYNFSSFEDDLRYDDYDANGWFINIVGKF